MRVGFVGFGEAGFHIAKGLQQPGIESISAFDINVTDKVCVRARETKTRLVESNRELAQSCDIMMSAVTANQALNAAEQNAPYLTADHIYADLNSVSPGLKQSIGRLIESTGARFAEIAMMAPVPPYGHKVPMLAGGAGAEAFVGKLAPFGISAEIVSREVGTAAATKMFRSIIVKGMEALITECVLGASRYNADERVFASLAESFPGSIGKNSPIIWSAEWLSTASGAPAKWKKWPPLCARSISSRSWPRPSSGVWTGASRRA